MGTYSIMIIDDDQSLHLIVGEYFKQSGYDVLHAEEGSRGLELLETNRPDLILLDIQMPVMDGFKTLEAIRRKEELKDVPIMLLTSLDRHSLKVKGLELGADDYITKPFNKDELMARVNALLRRSSRNKRSGSMEGELSDIGLSDLLQSMELGSKTASIFLRDIDAEIIVKEGALLHCRFKSFTGEDSLVRIFLLERGHFSILFNEIPQGLPDNNLKPLMSVLMSVLAVVDDVKEVINKIRVNNRLIKIDEDVSEFPNLKELKQTSPMTFTEILVHMKGDIKENLKILISASKKGKLKIIKT